MLPEFVDLAPDQSELVVSFYFGNQRVILQIELQSLFEVVFFACFWRLKFMALWHMVLSQR